LKSLGVPFPCLNIPQHFWDSEMLFSPPCRWDSASLAHWESVLPSASGPVDLTEGLTSPGALESGLSYTKEPGEGSRTNWEPHVSDW
jgi:hypothetical protein